ncbi:endonuclease/exonuclease/phosphatase family protein [Nocardioides sp. BP30]|uniref:endonuclease/exonuclease/phosphatase family protein n=1 Tax=Nocardioides sp. BP30 TaxID=3036374 RepID=UPI002469C36A|nr:endonuclease/exonuclease/phosphatase family protein [Nocardioides sp. BP30]WGL51483.1 endonuclease/exonuclease/phosphatase family protein [Nocardioides sp. BP30]
MRLGASVLAGVVAATLGIGLLTGTSSASANDAVAVGPASSDRLTTPAAASTSFRVATFNVLGNSHTTAHGDESTRPSGTKRMTQAVQAINEGRPSIIGFQEMERVQYAAFKSQTGGTYGTYPGDDTDQLVVANNIAWRTDTWRLMSATTFTVPYFYGKYSRRPLVLLQNIRTGQEVYVMNTHNPADVRGNALAWRNQGVAIEAALITRLRSTHPGIPVLFTGDMNDWSNFYCPVTSRAPVHAAYGGTHAFTPTDQCSPPTFVSGKTSYRPIDWILGTPDVTFSGATRLKDATVAVASDHPLYWADATVKTPAASATGITHVVAIDAEGLTSSALTKSGGRHAPFLNSLRAAGASTLDARTAPDSTKVLPNAIGMLTGRKVLKKGGGGHGVKGSGDDGKTVASHAMGYVSSVYDVVHDFGRSTALYSSDPNAKLIKRSWSKAHGAADRVGGNNGTKKIGKSVISSTDKALTASFRKGTAHLKAFSLVQLTGAVRAGQKSGWSSKKYRSAVKTVDHRIASIVHAVRADPATAASTLVIVTASAGGKGHATGGSKKADFRVPFIVWGRGVPAHQDLYALNPALLGPGSANPGLTVGQPVRNAMVADLATTALGLPAVPGSIFDSGRDLNVAHAPVATLPHDPALQPAATAAARAG